MTRFNVVLLNINTEDERSVVVMPDSDSFQDLAIAVRQACQDLGLRGYTIYESEEVLNAV